MNNGKRHIGLHVPCPERLKRKVKSEAALEGKPYGEFIVAILESEMKKRDEAHARAYDVEDFRKGT